jgi:alkaline phosphatase
LQAAAIEAGYSNVILMIFDGMDWQTTRAAAIYKNGRVTYDSGRGNGLSFQDDRRVQTDFGLICTSSWTGTLKVDASSQTLLGTDFSRRGGYDPRRGGEAPWLEPPNNRYLLGLDREQPHVVTDSAASATSLTSGIKTYNYAINVSVEGEHVVPIARRLQDEEDFRVGIVSNVPVSHASTAAAYANNVTRMDYQDISRDLIGLPSSSHRTEALPGVDVLIGGGWGVTMDSDAAQGSNFLPGNRFLHEEDLRRADIKHGGRYHVAQRTSGQPGKRVLMRAARRAIENDERLLGFFGTRFDGHLPFQTADGKFDPAEDAKGIESYSQADIDENPTLAEMTRAALLVLEQAVEGFWLMVEAGDVDWANHANNLDNAIGSVFSGEEAFRVIMDWVDENNAWSYTAVIVTSDHGHYLVIDDPERIAEAGRNQP